MRRLEGRIPTEPEHVVAQGVHHDHEDVGQIPVALVEAPSLGLGGERSLEKSADEWQHEHGADRQEPQGARGPPSEPAHRSPGELAEEQEPVASVQANRAKVVAAEAQVPLAMAEALRSGNLGVMDMLRLKNIESDTTMRRSIGGIDPTSGGTEEPGA